MKKLLAGVPLLVLSACSQGTDTGGLVEADERDDVAKVSSLPTTLAGKGELTRMRAHLAERYADSDVWHRYRTPTGDDVDCVDFHRQPAMRLGAFGSTPPRLDAEAPPPDGDVDTSTLVDPTALDEEGRQQHCPEGSVPILRQTLADVARFTNLQEYLGKNPRTAGGELTARGSLEDAPEHGGPGDHWHATWRQTGLSNLGAQSVINLWSPATERNSEFSLAQLWVWRGTGSNTETVEAGWQVYGQKYGDTLARLFIYFTPDNYGSGGCYNLDCTGFVQTDTSIVIGGSFTSYSTIGGSQKTITLRYQYCDTVECPSSSGWWLKYGSTWVGYYPRTLFDTNGIRTNADRIQFGGETTDHITTRATATNMGSSNFSSSTCTTGSSSTCFGQVAYQRNIQYIDTAKVWQTPTISTANTTNSSCYNTHRFSQTGGWGRYIFFGGTGFSTSCP